MLTRREILERNCKQELSYIESAIDWDKTGAITEAEKREAIVNSILKGINKVKGGMEIFRDEKTVSLRDTPWYKFAQILQTEYVNNKDKFFEEVKRKIPTYESNPRGALKLLGLPWLLKFEIPDAPKRPKISAAHRRRKLDKVVIAPKPGLREMPEAKIEGKIADKSTTLEVTFDTVPKGTITVLENEIADLKERLNELTDFVLTEALGFDKYERVKKLIRG